MLVLLCLRLAQGEVGTLNKPPPLHLSNGDASLDVILERRILRFQSARPDASLEQRVDSLRALLEVFFLDHPKESQYSFVFGSYNELNSRMARAVSCSPQWDFDAGRVRSGDTAAWLRDYLGEIKAYDELLPVFDALGYRIEIASMESIALCGTSEIDLNGGLRPCRTPIPPKAKLPCGALITFKLIAK